MTCPTPGLYRDVPFDEYAAWDAANASRLIPFMRSARHALHEIQTGGKDTKAKDLGWLTHLAVLEPERFASEVVVAPKFGRKNIEKAAKAAFLDEHADHYVVDEKTYALALAMATEVLAHPTAAELFGSKGPTEVSMVWIDPETGILCKGRIDKIGKVGQNTVLADFKTSSNASPHTFSSDAASYGYHIQACHYLSGLEALKPFSGGQRTFLFVVVESAPPHVPACYVLDDGALEEGERRRRKYLSAYKECRETNIWPGYSGNGIEYLMLPNWAVSNFDET